ncbi:DUF2190 family protein [Roseovarius sp. SYSU LYC5161]|uniref:DUF2190 family protein n=1 Tax=Roseovarius halophilus (ex Wu et al. 2025) TaxID=3376060 RepID=UPI00399A79EA
MAKNYIRAGQTITATSGSSISSGDIIVLGSLVGITMTDAESGEEHEVAIEGVWEVPKVSAQAWTQGAAIYWDSSAYKATTASSGNTKMGYAAEAAGNPSATGRVKLWP